MEVKLYKDFPVVEAEGEIDHWRAPELEQKINEVIEKGHHTVVIDFSALTYIDSGGVSVLFLQLQKLKPVKGKLIVVTNNKNIIKILSLVKITKQECFSLYADMEEAKKELN